MKQLQLLTKGQLLTANAATSLRVLSGEVWITIEGDENDHVLTAGQSINNPENSLMVIESLADASLNLIPDESKMGISA